MRGKRLIEEAGQRLVDLDAAGTEIEGPVPAGQAPAARVTDFLQARVHDDRGDRVTGMAGYDDLGHGSRRLPGDEDHATAGRPGCAIRACCLEIRHGFTISAGHPPQGSRLPMTRESILPQGEALRRAVRWLGEQPRRDAASIEEAARRFDLTPADEEFLLRHFRDEGAGPGRSRMTSPDKC